jgi:hypothetical protein
VGTATNDNRMGKRRKLYFYLEVLDQKTGETIGRLVDIHFAGMLLISDKELEPNKQFDLRVVINDPQFNAPSGALDVQVLTRWSKLDVNPSYYVTGVQFVNITQSQERLIGELIQAIGFRD